ncbi:MAG TPA: hypothetical protein DEA08_28365 [Planctomycetes bacterium]|nr:hypothetical protein [Planctomycetota bacterium]
MTVSSADWLTSEDEVVLPAPVQTSPEGIVVGAAALAAVSFSAAGLCAWSGWGLEAGAWGLCAALSCLVARVAQSEA